MKKGILKAFLAISSISAAFGMAASAGAAPVFEYNFPASGTGTAASSPITDLSAAGNNGFSDGTLSYDAALPPGAPGSNVSVNTTAGGILTNTTDLLDNSTVAAAGGFQFHVWFNWNGTDSSSFGHTEKLIDYAGTESLQLVTTTGSASLQMQFGDDSGNESIPVSTTISPNTWYEVTMNFGNTSLVSGDVSGTASLIVNGGAPITGAATKGTFGDSLNREIGVGQLGANFGYLVGFKGDIYDPSVNLGVPEPTCVGLLGISAAALLARRRRTIASA